MAKSVTEPISQAYERTAAMLFKPFEIRKWFVLGFAAFLAQLGEGAGGGGNNIQLPRGTWPARTPAPAPPPMPIPGPGPGGASGPTFPTTFPTPPTPQEEFAQFMTGAKQFLLNNLAWIVPVVILGIVIIIILMWLRARGKFIFLDGVANDRAAIVEPWKRLAPQANSYFRFVLILGVLMVLVIALAAFIAYTIALPDIQAQQFGAPAITAIIVGGLMAIGWTITFGIINALADDFLIPLMYLRITSIGPAWQEFRQQILPGNFWSIVLFYLMRIVLAIATAIVAGFAACLTCFIAVIPYLGTVLFLPLFIFHRCYSLYFLRQFGPEYNLIVERMPQLMSAFPVIMPPNPTAPWPPQAGGDFPPMPPPHQPPPYQPPPPADSPRRL